MDLSNGIKKEILSAFQGLIRDGLVLTIDINTVNPAFSNVLLNTQYTIRSKLFSDIQLVILSDLVPDEQFISAATQF